MSGDAGARELTLTIGSRLEDVALMGVAVNRVGRFLGYPSADAARLELCVVEAATNAIRHAYGGERSGSVSVRLVAGAERLEIRVIDRGRPIPPTAWAPAAPAADPTDPGLLPESGRGLRLIHELMDRVEFSAEAGANVLLMVKALPCSSDEAG